MPSEVKKTPESAWKGVTHAFRSWFHEPDMEAARVLYAAVVAHRLPGQPVWPMLIAPPGSMKTELLKSLASEGVISVDSVTPRTFLSGQIGQTEAQPSSLLHRIGSSGIVVIADFSTVASKGPEERGQIYADLRRIFDGKITKHFGTKDSGTQEWQGRLTVCVATTPQIDAYRSFEQVLGDRFISVRMARGSRDAAVRAQRQDPVTVTREIEEAVAAMFATIAAKPAAPQVSEQIEGRIADLAEFACLARAHVGHDAAKQITGGSLDEAESPTRLSQQLNQLVKGHALLAGRAEVAEADLWLVARVVFDSMLPRRAEIFKRLLANQPVHKSTSSLKYALEDLEYLGLVEVREGVVVFTDRVLELVGPREHQLSLF